MESKIEMELILSFECHRCRGTVWIQRSQVREFSGDRAFCGNCGAAYVYYERENVITIERITFGEMYLPPVEWCEISQQGAEHGLADGKRTEALNRRNRTFWQRLWVAIRNR